MDPIPLPTPNSADLTELSRVTVILDTHHCLTLDALGCPLWKREFQRARWGSDEEIHKKQNSSFLLSHFLPYFLSFPYACWDVQSHLVCQQVGEAIASHELSSLPDLSSLQLCMESCISLFSTWVFTCSYVSERKILSVGDLTSWGEKKKLPAPDMQLLCLLQGLLPARNDFKGLEWSPADTICSCLSSGCENCYGDTIMAPPSCSRIWDRIFWELHIFRC